MFFKTKTKAGPRAATQPGPTAGVLPPKDAAVPASVPRNTTPSPQRPFAANPHARAEAFQEIVALLAVTEPYRRFPIARVLDLVGPAIGAGQYAVLRRAEQATGATRPVAAAMWARVSVAVDTRMRAAQDQPVPLDAADWNSGDIAARRSASRIRRASVR